MAGVKDDEFWLGVIRRVGEELIIKKAVFDLDFSDGDCKDQFCCGRDY